MMEKQELRARMRAMRRALSKEAQEAASLAVHERLRCFAPYREARRVMAYAACRGELSLETVIGELLAAGKTLLLPRCEAPGVMTARRIDSMDQLVPGAYGLMEPDMACEIVSPDEIDLILVPGTAFDRAGNRLGQGGGYYDRFLEKSCALRVGVCHDEALINRIPSEEHDSVMDAVITPQETIWLDRHRRNGHG